MDSKQNDEVKKESIDRTRMDLYKNESVSTKKEKKVKKKK